MKVQIWKFYFHTVGARFTGKINFPRYRKLAVFNPDIPGTPIYRAKPFPPSNLVNRGPTVTEQCTMVFMVFENGTHKKNVFHL